MFYHDQMSYISITFSIYSKNLHKNQSRNLKEQREASLCCEDKRSILLKGGFQVLFRTSLVSKLWAYSRLTAGTQLALLLEVRGRSATAQIHTMVTRKLTEGRDGILLACRTHAPPYGLPRMGSSAWTTTNQRCPPQTLPAPPFDNSLEWLTKLKKSLYV